ncbi:hypothetical protein [Chryseobacterium sp.]|uniref:hypothetical protein n=1 Tax=Chryseobacterium sp. TaxID=1871047 RepID=UPI0024E23A35|nr:hypothetical protein [Chryseobacterium sp.]
MKGGGGGSQNYSRQLAGTQGAVSTSDDEECLNILFDVHLKKIQSQIFKLNVGDVLQIDLDQEMQLVNVLSKGVLCGIVDAPQVLQLRSCIKKGYRYKATIIELDGNEMKCKVRIQYLQTVL